MIKMLLAGLVLVLAGTAMGELVVEVQTTDKPASTQPATQPAQTVRSSVQTLAGADGHFLATLVEGRRTIRLQGKVGPVRDGDCSVQVSFSDTSSDTSGGKPFATTNSINTHVMGKLGQPIKIGGMQRVNGQSAEITMKILDQPQP